MLYQELPSLESTRLDGWGRWLAPALAGMAGITIALVLVLIGQKWLALGFLVGGAVAAGLLYR